MKQHLVLLHGALGTARQLAPLAAQLEKDFHVHTFDFDGHGSALSGHDFTMEHFAVNLENYLEQNGINECDVFGYSMGGYVALKSAANGNKSIRRIVTLGTKLEWSPAIAQKETAMLDPEKIAEKVPKFALALEAAHQPNDWKTVLHKTAAMMRELGDQPALGSVDFARIEQPVLLCLGSEDTMVTPAETQAVETQLSQGKFRTVAGAQHPIERVNAEELAGIVREFLK